MNTPLRKKFMNDRKLFYAYWAGRHDEHANDVKDKKLEREWKESAESYMNESLSKKKFKKALRR